MGQMRKLVLNALRGFLKVTGVARWCTSERWLCGRDDKRSEALLERGDEAQVEGRQPNDIKNPTEQAQT
jgi:hypothetical protein